MPEIIVIDKQNLLSNYHHYWTGAAVSPGIDDLFLTPRDLRDGLGIEGWVRVARPKSWGKRSSCTLMEIGIHL
jgi:hypothetical protein